MSDRLVLVKEYIKIHEGLRLKKYKDTVGKWTIGYGHLITIGENYDIITKEKADEIFEEDFQKHYEQAKRFPGFSKLPFQKQTVIIDMCFNMGEFYLKWLNFTRHMNEGNFKAAAEDIRNSKYAKQVGRRAKDNIDLLLK